MTTAHRPTYNATRGGNDQGGNKLYIPSKMYSSKDLPSNLKLKTRRPGQGTTRDLKGKDFKSEILQREHQNLKEKRSLGLVSSIYEDIDIESNDINDTIDFTSDLPQIDAPNKKQKTEENENNLDDISRISKVKESMKDSEVVFPQDKDYEYESDDESNGNRDKSSNVNDQNDNLSNEESSSFSSEDEDSEEELYRELEKIKKMREDQNKEKELENIEKNKIQIQEDIIKGNPLLSHSGYSLKKKWFEDTVFKNQAKNEVKTKKRFINDTVRSDFHRKFLSKTMQ